MYSDGQDRREERGWRDRFPETVEREARRHKVAQINRWKSQRQTEEFARRGRG